MKWRTLAAVAAWWVLWFVIGVLRTNEVWWRFAVKFAAVHVAAMLVTYLAVLLCERARKDPR